MKYLSSKDSHEIKAESCTILEYPLGDKDINGALVKINGRFPEKGRIVNQVCKEMAYVIEGEGKVVVEGQEYLLSSGDLLIINPGEKYFWEGILTMFVPSTPAWYPEQNLQVD